MNGGGAWKTRGEETFIQGEGRNSPRDPDTQGGELMNRGDQQGKGASEMTKIDNAPAGEKEGKNYEKLELQNQHCPEKNVTNHPWKEGTTRHGIKE